METKQKKPQTKSQPKKELRTMHFSKTVLVVFVIVFASIGTYLLLQSKALPPPPPTVYLTTPSSFMPINTNFSVQIRENSATTTVNAVQANISYPASLLTLVSVDTTGTAFSVEAQNTSGSGSVAMARGTCGGCAAVTGDQLIATLNFRTNAVGGAATAAFTSGTLLVSSTTNTDILGGLGATGGFTVNVDTTAPAVSITNPVNNATAGAGSSVSVTISATDADRVSSVDLFLDGTTKLTTLTTAPYTYTWNTAGVALGPHTLQAKATDPSGNLGTSSAITVNVVDQTPPTTAVVTSPSAGSFLNGTQTINANAADNPGGTGILKVEFYDGATLIGTDTTSPYTASWNTTTATNGSHNLTIKAYDNGSPANVTTSSGVTVTVDNSAPTTPASFQSTGNTLTSVSLSWLASSDNNSVTGYRLTRNGTVIATPTAGTLAYNDTNLASGTTYTYTIVALDAAGNASAAASLQAATKTPIPGDANGDNKVDAIDLSMLLTNWGTSNAATDFNHDGKVDALDLSTLLSHWG
jgi:hypothetical protein